MSRCFPYPPPGYTLSRSRNDALIESIKLRKEREKAKEQRKKEKRREKKEIRKERKERKEKREEKKDKTNQCLDKSDILKGHTGQNICSDTKTEFLHKRREAEFERLERSSLTEEHGQPVRLPVPSSSSDSTENSNKRKRQSSTMDGGHGNIILIRLPSKKQNEFDALAKECSTSGRADFPAQNKKDIRLRDRPENFCPLEGTNNIGQGFTLRTNREQIYSTLGQIEAVAPGKIGIKSTPGAVVTSMRKDLQYKNLIENWAPPLLQDACLYPDDLDWLFQGKNEDIRAMKRQRSGNDSLSCSRSSALRSRAEYLHEVDAYALPFTVPF